MPIRPFRLAADGLHAGPGKAFAADADAVADGPALAEHVIERGITGIDDDGAGRFAGIERNDWRDAAAPEVRYVLPSPRSESEGSVGASVMPSDGNEALRCDSR